MADMQSDDIISFWFKEIEPKQWWAVDPAFDDLLKSRYSDLLLQASACELYSWRTTARGRLAEIIVLDQFSRNIHRNTPGAFAQDPLALALSQEAVGAGAPQELTETERAFLLMPYMHSESRPIHVQAEILFKQFTPPYNYDFELKHKAIIDRFGRYPHRNKILGRNSSPEEIEFLKQPGSAFQVVVVYPDAMHVNEGASAAELAYAGEVLRRGERVVVYGGFLVLKSAGDRILCEVVDQDPLSHRCAEEFAVMVENARLALTHSGLNLAGKLLQWRVIDVRPEGIVELWRAG